MIYWFPFYPAAHYPQPWSLQEYWLESCRFRALRRLIVSVLRFIHAAIAERNLIRILWWFVFEACEHITAFMVFSFVSYHSIHRRFPYICFFIIITYRHLSERGKEIFISQHVAFNVTMGAEHSRTYIRNLCIWIWNKKKMLLRSMGGNGWDDDDSRTSYVWSLAAYPWRGNWKKISWMHWSPFIKW